MDEKELITSLQSHLSTALSPPVGTSAWEDSRPVPVIIIDDWDTNDFNFNNSAKRGEYHDSNTYEWYLNFSYRTRVEFLVRHSDEVEVSTLKSKLKHELRLIRENPQQFHKNLKSCNLGADGNPSYKFTEPREAELMVSARFHGDHTVTRTPNDSPHDTINTITDDFTFNP